MLSCPLLAVLAVLVVLVVLVAARWESPWASPWRSAPRYRAHFVTAVAVGGRPTVGIDKGRPTVYSGLDATKQKRQQFLFSSMGLNVQALLDEAILDVPHGGGGAFERGVLAGGIATALFYVTLGRTASVSDVDFMARTSSLSKGDITIIYGGVALMHAVRIHHDGRYANFFVRPAPAGEHGLRVGVHVE